MIRCVPFGEQFEINPVVEVLRQLTLLKQTITTYHGVNLVVGVVTGSVHVDTIYTLMSDMARVRCGDEGHSICTVSSLNRYK